MKNPEREEEPRIEELGNLPEELEPPPELERRVLGALRERGLVVSGDSPPLSQLPRARRRGARRAPRWTALAAASLLAFTAGWFGRALALETPPPASDDHRPRFLLLLSEPAAGGELPPDELAARVEEYGAWAHGLARRGLLERADRLEPHAVRLSESAGGDAGPVGREAAAAADDPGTVSGFFLIRAGDLDQARRVAETCPHLRHGGRVTVRPIAG